MTFPPATSRTSFAGRWLLIVVLVVVLLSLAAPAVVLGAETTASSPTEPGPEEQRFRRRTKPAEPPTPVTPAIEDQTPPYVEPPVSADLRPFPVRTIRVEGAILIPAEELERLVAPYEGREATLADLRRLAAELTQWLRGHGYVTSRVYLPPQDVTEGIVTVQIFEGRIGEVRAEGGARWARPETLVRRMRSRAGAALDYRLLRGDLAMLNANLDREISAVLVPGKATGTTDLVLRVDERRPIHVGYLAHNAGTRTTGRFRQGFVAGHSNLTGHDDQLVIRTEVSERSRFVGTAASFLIPVGAGGRTFGFDASHAEVTLGRQFQPLDIEGTATVLGMTWAEPLWRDERWELEWVTGFDGKRIRSKETRSVRGKDDLRVLRLGPSLLERDAFGRSILTTELGIGFSRFLGGSRKVDAAASRAQTGGQFVRLTVSGGRLQRVWGRLQVLLRGTWQWTDDRLPPAETLQIGGAETVRGYPQAEFLGDYGYVGSVELRIPVPVPIGLPPRAASPLTFVGFVDTGGAFLRKPLQTEEARRRLTGVGVGLRWALSQHMAASVDLGLPVGDTSSDENRPQVHYSINAGF